MIRRDTYKRAESVIMEDTIGMPLDSIDTLKKEVITALEKYMKVYDMYVEFKRLDSGKCSIKITGTVSNLTLPTVP